MFEHEDRRWALPAAFRARHEEFIKGFVADGKQDSAMVRLIESPSPFSDDPKLQLRTGTVSFSDVRYFREEMLRRESIAGMVNETVDSHLITFPSGMTAQIVIVTTDDKVLLTQRSATVFWFPSRWSLSIEENMKTDDVSEGGNSVGAVRTLICRAVREELSLQDGADYRIDDARVLSCFVETHEQVLAAHLCIVVRLRLTQDDLDARIALADRTDDEFRRWIFASPRQLLPYVAGPRDERLHPTTRYRMVMFLWHAWGAEALLRGLEHAGARDDGSDPLGLYEVP